MFTINGQLIEIFNKCTTVTTKQTLANSQPTLSVVWGGEYIDLDIVDTGFLVNAKANLNYYVTLML